MLDFKNMYDCIISHYSGCFKIFLENLYSLWYNNTGYNSTKQSVGNHVENFYHYFEVINYVCSKYI